VAEVDFGGDEVEALAFGGLDDGAAAPLLARDERSSRMEALLATLRSRLVAVLFPFPLERACEGLSEVVEVEGAGFVSGVRCRREEGEESEYMLLPLERTGAVLVVADPAVGEGAVRVERDPGEVDGAVPPAAAAAAAVAGLYELRPPRGEGGLILSYTAGRAVGIRDLNWPTQPACGRDGGSSARGEEDAFENRAVGFRSKWD